PDHNRRMIAVAPDHRFHVAHRQVLPAFVADVLPARWLLPRHQSQLVAGIQKRFRLRIVRAAHDVAVELLAQNLRIAAQQTRRRSEAKIRIELVTVQPEQLRAASVQEKPIHGETRLAESDARRGTMHGTLVEEKRYLHAIKMRMLRIP